MPLNHYMDTCTSFEEAPGLGYFGAACADGGLNVVTPPKDQIADTNDSICYHGPVFSEMFMNS